VQFLQTGRRIARTSILTGILILGVIDDTIVLRATAVTPVRNVRFAPPGEVHVDLKRRAIDAGIPSKELTEKGLYTYIEQNRPVQSRLPLGRSVEIDTEGT